MVFSWMSTGSPDRLRSFDPFRIADLEYRMWVAYYLHRWTHLVAASVRLLWLGFGTDLARIVPGAWLMLRAVQSWAPFPDNDPDGAQARMRELYGLVRLRFGQPADRQHGNVVFLPEALRRHGNQVGRFDADGAKALETIEFAGLAARFDDTVGEEYYAITGPETKVNLVVGRVGGYTQR